MYREYRDLTSLLGELRGSVPDDRLIWCAAADGFETTVSQRRGLILGGAWSPHFLRDKSASWWEVPWTLHLRAPVIVTVDKAFTPLTEWLPLMESIAQSGESLMLVTRDVSTELLHTFVVNYLHNSLACCVIRDAEVQAGWGLPATNIPWRFAQAPPNRADILPRGAEAWVRRTATVLFPAEGSEWRAAASDITVISVGGENHDDQIDRLRLLMKALQQPI